MSNKEQTNGNKGKQRKTKKKQRTTQGETKLMNNDRNTKEKQMGKIKTKENKTRKQ